MSNVPLEFTRYDGKSVSVSCVQCPKCNNYFWVQFAEIEMPSFCAYCGLRFSGHKEISKEEMEGEQQI